MGMTHTRLHYTATIANVAMSIRRTQPVTQMTTLGLNGGSESTSAATSIDFSRLRFCCEEVRAVHDGDQGTTCFLIGNFPLLRKGENKET